MSLLFVGVVSESRAQVSDSTVVRVETLVAEALQHNPELQGYAESRRVAAARIPQVSALPAPEFRFKIMEASSSNLFDPAYWKYVNFELMQMVPFPGKLGNAKRIAEFEAEHAHHDYEEKTLELTARVKSAYYEIFFIQQAVALNRENIQLLQQILGVARARYAVGKTMNQDFLKANVELAKLQNEQITLEQQADVAVGRLNTLLNRPLQSRFGRATIPATTLPSLVLEELQKQALSRRPMLLHDSLKVVQAQVMRKLAHREYWPDFTLSAEYVTSPMDGFRGWSAMAGVTLPFAFWTIKRPRGLVQEATAEIGKMAAELNASQSMINFEVQEALIKVQTAHRLVELYRSTVLPQAEQALQATLSAYRTQQAEFMMLLDSYRMLYGLQLEYFEALATQEKSLAALERAVGSELRQDLPERGGQHE